MEEIGSDSIFNNKTIYFFGAGASVFAVPTMNKLKNRIKEFQSFFYKINYYLSKPEQSGILNQYSKICTCIFEDLSWIIIESEGFSSLDTLAKKYFLTEDKDSLNRLKKTLCVYFYFEQWSNFDKIIKMKVDEDYQVIDLRYDELMSSLLVKENHKTYLNENVGFVTWNYDLQFEKTLLKYVNVNTINQLKEDYFIIPNRKTFDNIDTSLTYINKATIIKLNGNAFLDHGLGVGKNVTMYDIKQKFEELNEFLEIFFTKYSKVFPNNSNYHNSLKYFNYAWEADSGDGYKTIQRTIKEAKRLISHAKTLIIVGYSFPYVNREIDKYVLSDCSPQKIVIQDLEPKIILGRLLSAVPKSVKHEINNKNIEIVFEEASNYFPSPD